VAKALAPLVFEEVPACCYVDGALEYSKALAAVYAAEKQTTSDQIDVLVWFYRISSSESVFSLLFSTHNFLLGKLTNRVFWKYYNYLTPEDYDDLLSMAYGEFHRRVLHYKIPPEAPFSAYIKLYMKKWLNVYAKIAVKHNTRNLLVDPELALNAQRNRRHKSQTPDSTT